MKQKQKPFYIIIFLTCILALTVFVCYYFFFRPPKAAAENLKKLSDENYNAFFASMYSTEGYLSTDFMTYRGIRTLVLDSGAARLRTLTDYIDAAFASPNEIETIYLGLDPAALWDACLHSEKLWDRQLASFLSRVDAHTDVTFEIMLPYPSLSYWTDMSEKDLDQTLLLYQTMGNVLCRRPNAEVHFIGAEEWLIANPGNYLEGFSIANPELTHKLLTLNFCDKAYLVREDSLSEKLDFLCSYVKSEKTSPAAYADLSDWYFVFLGDSVMVCDNESSSIPGVICSLSGADSANLSQGGSPATKDPEAPIYLERMTDALETLDADNYKEIPEFHKGLEKYIADTENGIIENKQLCFVICMGLNDYFGAHPVDRPSDPYHPGSYGGALRNAVRRLQKIAPDGRILITTPSFCNIFSEGTESTGPEGGVLTDYVDTALAVCREMHVDCVDIYADSGINAMTHSLYLADGVHPNADGRYHLGKFLINRLGEILSEN